MEAIEELSQLADFMLQASPLLAEILIQEEIYFSQCLRTWQCGIVGGIDVSRILLYAITSVTIQ